MARLAVITDDPGWHGRILRQAFGDRGHEVFFLSLVDCHLSLESGSLPIQLPGFEDGLPDGVFVRGVPGGTLEQVTLHLDILHGLELLGIPVYNDTRAIERTVDKAMTSLLLHQAGIPTPPAWIIRDPETARERVLAELSKGHRVVSKPLFGSQGVGLRRYSEVNDLDGFGPDNGIFYLQRFVDSGSASHDFRIFVVGGRAIAAMRRSGLSWLNNVHQGARCEAVPLEERLLVRLAEEAVHTLGMHYAGVDVIRDLHGKALVLEVNSIPAWKGLQGVTEVPIADRLADDFLNLIHPPQGLIQRQT